MTNFRHLQEVLSKSEIDQIQIIGHIGAVLGIFGLSLRLSRFLRGGGSAPLLIFKSALHLWANCLRAT